MTNKNISDFINRETNLGTELDNKNFFKRNAKPLIIAFVVPFINMCTYLIESLCNLFKYQSQYQYYGVTNSEAYGFHALFFVLPILFILTLITPQCILKVKKQILKTLGFMFLFGWILVFFSWYFVGVIERIYQHLH